MIWQNIKSTFFRQSEPVEKTPLEKTEASIKSACYIIADMQRRPGTDLQTLEEWYSLLTVRLHLSDNHRAALNHKPHGTRLADIMRARRDLKTKELRLEIKLGIV